MGVAWWDWICRMYYCDIFQNARPHHWARAIKLSIAGFRHQCQRRGAIFVAMDRWMMAFQYCDSSLQIATLCLCAFYCWGSTTPRISNFMTDFRLVTSAVVCLPTCLSVVLFPLNGILHILYVGAFCLESTLVQQSLLILSDFLSGPAFRQRFPKPGAGSQDRDTKVYSLGCLKTIQPNPRQTPRHSSISIYIHCTNPSIFNVNKFMLESRTMPTLLQAFGSIDGLMGRSTDNFHTQFFVCVMTKDQFLTMSTRLASLRGGRVLPWPWTRSHDLWSFHAGEQLGLGLGGMMSIPEIGDWQCMQEIYVISYF